MQLSACTHNVISGEKSHNTVKKQTRWIVNKALTDWRVGLFPSQTLVDHFLKPSWLGGGRCAPSNFKWGAPVGTEGRLFIGTSGRPSKPLNGASHSTLSRQLFFWFPSPWAARPPPSSRASSLHLCGVSSCSSPNNPASCHYYRSCGIAALIPLSGIYWRVWKRTQ